MAKSTPKRDKKYWRTKIIIGIKTYSEGSTEKEAIQNIFDKITKYPEIEEHIFSCKLINGSATHPMSEKETLEDSTAW
jgi:hypothetical protein